MAFLKQKVFPLLLPKSLGGEGPTALICGMYLECIEIALRCMWQYPYVLYVFQNLGSYTM